MNNEVKKTQLMYFVRTLQRFNIVTLNNLREDTSAVILYSDLRSYWRL